MALDSKLKRGSVMNIGQPWRPWIGEPDGTIAAVDRAGVAKLSASIPADPPVVANTRSDRLEIRLGLGI